jgi:lysophospholipid acyltransferase (LPLAT)-like uncharacterized protein
MKLRKVRQDFLRFIGDFSLLTAVNILCKTLSIEKQNYAVLENLVKQNKNYVLAFWHGSMLVPWFLHRNQNLVALISKSKDGNLLAKVLKRWNYTVVRGSSTEGGEVALGILVDYAKNECSIVITPDGPKGPRHKLKAGAVITAKKSGLPLILIGVGFKNKSELKSWDKFYIPHPFSKVKIIYSNPIFIDKDLSYEDTSLAIKNCEDKLNELHDKANIF